MAEDIVTPPLPPSENQGPFNLENNLPAQLSQNEIAEKHIPQSELWYLQLSSKNYGPIHTTSLQNFIRDHSHFSLETLARPATELNWKPLFKFPIFDRRKIEETSQKKFDGNELYILKDGQKKGPFTLSDVKFMLDKHKILYTSLISSDAGKTWNKIYEYDQFDRRKKSFNNDHNDLPIRPSLSEERSLLEQEKQQFEYFTEKKKEERKTKEALIGLVVMGKTSAQKKSLKAKTGEAVAAYKENIHKTYRSWATQSSKMIQGFSKKFHHPFPIFEFSKTHKVVIITLLLIGLVGGGQFFYQKYFQKDSQRNTASKIKKSSSAQRLKSQKNRSVSNRKVRNKTRVKTPKLAPYHKKQNTVTQKVLPPDTVSDAAPEKDNDVYSDIDQLEKEEQDILAKEQEEFEKFIEESAKQSKEEETSEQKELGELKAELTETEQQFLEEELNLEEFSEARKEPDPNLQEP